MTKSNNQLPSSCYHGYMDSHANTLKSVHIYRNVDNGKRSCH